MINIVELDERINKCLAILQDNPRSRIFAALAEAYRRRGDVGRAFSICKNGLRAHPDYGAAHVVMAKLYLHQNMADQARASIERAVELDGPSRSTDLVLADIYLETGDMKNVREMLARLDRVGGTDPAVESLRARLSQSAKILLPEQSSTTAGSPSAQHSSPIRRTVESTVRGFCHDPAEAVDLVLQVRQTLACVLWDDAGNRLAAGARSGLDVEAVADETWELFKNIDQQLAAYGWGRLSTVRIEEPQGRWGMLRREGMVALVQGTARLRYAAATRKAAECLNQMANSDNLYDGDQQTRPTVAEETPD